MTIYQSPIVLGTHYTDKRTEIEGYATALFFSQEGCVEVSLEFAKDSKIEHVTINERRLIDNEGKKATDYDALDYESDIILGHAYEDIQTGLKGYAAVMEFHEDLANRCTIKAVSTRDDGSQKLTYYSIDDFLLKGVHDGKVAGKKSSAPSPITREVDYR